MIDDIAELKARVDLAALVEQDLGPPRRRNGRWLWWLCPFHRESQPSFGVTPDTGRFKCFGCGASGDHLDYLEQRQGLSTAQAITALRGFTGLPGVLRASRTQPPVAHSQDLPPSLAWQDRARAFVAYAREQLWTPAGEPGLAYLRQGGLTEATIRHFGLGWNPGDLWDEPGHWGLEGNRVYLPRGVVIPCEVSGNLWYVKIRRFDARGRPRTKTGNKYGAPRGGKGALFGADGLGGTGRPLLLCEGERDAVLAHQELSDVVDVASLGGAGRRSLGAWVLWLLPYRLILVAYDADAAGREGATYLLGWSERVKAIRVPHGGDLTGFRVGGGDLKAWLGDHLASTGTSTAQVI